MGDASRTIKMEELMSCSNNLIEELKVDLRHFLPQASALQSQRDNDLTEIQKSIEDYEGNIHACKHKAAVAESESAADATLDSLQKDLEEEQNLECKLREELRESVNEIDDLECGRESVEEQRKTIKKFGQDITRAHSTSNGPRGWTSQEDLALMYAWVNVSQNAFVGTNQNSPTFWKRIWEMYEEARVDNLKLMGEERSIESLRNRYKRLNANVTKWMTAYKEAYDQKGSGMSDADVEKIAQQLYSCGKSTKFTHHEVFEKIMRHYPKWELKLGVDRHRTRIDRVYAGDDDVEKDRVSSKRSRTIENPNDETHVSEASTIHRPIGREKTKGKRKEKGNASHPSLILGDYTEALHAMRITREKEVEAINRMGNIKLLNTLLIKSYLSPQEESLKKRLMQELFP